MYTSTPLVGRKFSAYGKDFLVADTDKGYFLKCLGTNEKKKITDYSAMHATKFFTNRYRLKNKHEVVPYFISMGFKLDDYFTCVVIPEHDEMERFLLSIFGSSSNQMLYCAEVLSELKNLIKEHSQKKQLREKGNS